MSRLRRSKIIQTVGEERFLAARAQLQQVNIAPNSSLRDARGVVDSIVSTIERSQAPRRRILHLLLSFFEDLPSYRFMMEVTMQYRNYHEEEKHYFWKWARRLLETGNEPQRKELGYALWCEFFEDPQTVEEAWQALTSPIPSEKALQTILIHAGPVPWEQKWSLFLDLQSRTDMHYYIFRSILHGKFDVYGQIDPYEALQILKQLKVPPGTEHLSKLQRELQKDLSY